MRVDDATVEKALEMAEEYPHSVLPATVEALMDLRDERALLREYEAWEADVVLNGDWSAATVRLTQEQHDWLTQISIRRNKLLGNIDESGEPGIRNHLEGRDDYD